jgi:hypothetical protein
LIVEEASEMDFFASPQARAKLMESSKWKPVVPEGGAR